MNNVHVLLWMSLWITALLTLFLNEFYTAFNVNWMNGLSGVMTGSYTTFVSLFYLYLKYWSLLFQFEKRCYVKWFTCYPSRFYLFLQRTFYTNICFLLKICCLCHLNFGIDPFSLFCFAICMFLWCLWE
jgi:hypothetical protein